MLWVVQNGGGARPANTAASADKLARIWGCIEMAVSIKSLESAKVSVMVQLPITLKAALDADGEKQNLGAASLIRQIVADHYDMDVDEVKRGRAKKYATVEERQAAQKARDKARRDLINQLLEAYKSGGQDAADKLLAQMQQQANGTEETEEQ